MFNSVFLFFFLVNLFYKFKFKISHTALFLLQSLHIIYASYDSVVFAKCSEENLEKMRMTFFDMRSGEIKKNRRGYRKEEAAVRVGINGNSYENSRVTGSSRLLGLCSLVQLLALCLSRSSLRRAGPCVFFQTSIKDICVS